MNKVYKTPTEAFETLYKYIMLYGSDFANTKACFNSSFTVVFPQYREITTKERKFNKEYADYEWNWYLNGSRDASEISEKAKIWKNMMIPGTSEVNSNYGHFWKTNDQLDRMIEEIKTNKNTRRAILVHYDLSELENYKYDTPCNVALNFYVLQDKLHLSVFARSIDLWFGFCNDQYCFSKLMEYVSEKTGYETSSMHWNITNLHLYERHWSKIQ